MTPDELKAIAERQADQDRKFPHLICQCNTPLCGQCSVRKLLSHTQDIRRDTAREIVELALQKLYGPHQPPTLQSFIASIRSTYGLTTETEEGR